MGDTERLDPRSIKYCERRIEHLKSQKRDHEMMMAKSLAEQVDPKHKKKREKSLQRMLECPETRKKLVERVDLKDVKKHAKEIDSLEEAILVLEDRKKRIMAAERSISLEAAQELAEQEEKLKDKNQQRKVKGKPLEQPTGEGSPESTLAGPSALPPPIHRYRPCPKGCDLAEYQKWMQEYQRVQDLNAATNNLPTQTRVHKDPATVAAVVDPGEQSMLINVAKAIVSVSYQEDGLDDCCTGVIIHWDMDNKTARILTCGCFGHDVDDDPKSKIFVCWPCKEDDGLIEAKLLFFSAFYQLSLLEVTFQGTLLDVPTQIPPFGSSPPKQGDEVFTLGRDNDLSLVVRRGTMLQQQCLGEFRQGFLFVDYELPECCAGGPVVDHHGDVVGLSLPSSDGSVILSISIALSCVHIWSKFGRIVRPFLGMCFRNVEVLDDLSGEIRFGGFVVDEVHPNSAAWNHGIRRGNVIVSFDEQSPKPLPEFEGFLLSVGSEHLNGTYTKADFKLEVQDALGVKRSITLHVPFSDVANDREVLE